MKALNPSEVIFSVFGIREGLIYSLLPAHERRKDPLLSFCAEYAGLRSRSVEHAWELCKWTDVLFEPPGPKETPEERRLRYAACLISDIGWREHPDYRGEQSLNLLAHAGLSGIDHQGRVFMALAVFYRHAGASQEHADELSERLEGAQFPSGRRSGRASSPPPSAPPTCCRSASPASSTRRPLSYDGDKLVLTIPKAYAGLDGERLRRRFELLAMLVEKVPEIRFGR